MKDLIAVIGPLLGLWVGNRLSSGQKEVDRLWELRRATYGAIQAEMNAMLSIGASLDLDIAQYSFEGALRSDQSDNQLGKFWERWRNAERRFSDDYLIVSPEYRRLFEEAQRDPEWRPEDTEEETYGRLSTRIREYQPQLLAVALREMETMNMGLVALGLRRLRTGERPTA